VLPSEREEKLESRKKKCMPERDREREREGGEGRGGFAILGEGISAKSHMQ